MAKKEVQTLSIDSLWAEMLPLYQEEQQKYQDKYKGKFITMVILFFLFIIPGFIYWLVVWAPTAEERQRMAAQFVENTLQKIGENENSPLNNVEIAMRDSITRKTYPLPVGTLSEMNFWFNREHRSDMLWNNFFKNIYHDTNIDSDLASRLLVQTDLVAEVSGAARFRGTNKFTKGLNKMTAAMDKLGDKDIISEDLIIETSAKLSLELSGIPVVLTNLKTTVKTVEMVEDEEGKKKRETRYQNTFTGVLAVIEDGFSYPHPMILKSRDWKWSTNRRINNGFRELETELASEEFNDNFLLTVKEEDGVAIRKTFQPRSIHKLVEIDKKNHSFVMSTTDQFTSFLLNSRRKGDMPLYIESIGSFFRSEENAKAAIEADLQPIVAISHLINDLVETKLIS